MKVIVAQIGAREHYAVPRALHRGGRLAALYTDFWAGPAVRTASRMIPQSPLRSLAGRWHPELGKAQVVSWNWRSLGWEASGRQKSKIGNLKSEISGRYFDFIEAGQKFARAVRDELKRRRDLSAETIFFAYDTGALEALEYLKERGVHCVVDQMDPNRVEADLVREEEKRWPGWTLRDINVPEAYFKRREQEWALADRVVVNSEFSKQALVQQGVPPEKLMVIPLCYEIRNQKSETRNQLQFSGFSFSASRPLKILFLGQVILRKGIQHLVEAAKLLQHEPMQFDVVGPIGISWDAVKSAPPNVTFHGRVTRDEAVRWYEQSDVFVLPTISDGFAITQIEAMAHGLPVIATSNCGAVVEDGLDGFMVPPRNAEALAKAIQQYIREKELLAGQRTAAFFKSKQFTLDKLGGKLLSLEKDFGGR